jgi:hypothetical protein
VTDHGPCALGGPNCTGSGEESDHIIERGMGGRKGAAKKLNDAPENRRWLCKSCHWLVHNQPWKLPGWHSKWDLG